MLPGDDAPGALHLGVRRDGVLIAVGTIAPDPLPDDGQPGDWRVRGMATDPAARGSGAGSAVLAGLIAHAEEQGARRIWCNARSPALNLYRRAGFGVVGEEFELPQIGPHFRMVRAVA